MISPRREKRTVGMRRQKQPLIGSQRALAPIDTRAPGRVPTRATDGALDTMSETPFSRRAASATIELPL
jgi:hypothetical protein